MPLFYAAILSQRYACINEFEKYICLAGAVHDSHKTLEFTAQTHLIVQRNIPTKQQATFQQNNKQHSNKTTSNIPTNNLLQLYNGTCYHLL